MNDSMSSVASVLEDRHFRRHLSCFLVLIDSFQPTRRVEIPLLLPVVMVEGHPPLTLGLGGLQGMWVDYPHGALMWVSCLLLMVFAIKSLCLLGCWIVSRVRRSDPGLQGVTRFKRAS